MTTTAQNKIDIEKAAAKIAMLIYQYDSETWEPVLVHRILRISRNLVSQGISYLARLDLIVDDVFDLRLTDCGREYVQGLEKNSSLDTCASSAAFKEEALTGLKIGRSDGGFVVSQKSEISNAALPTGGTKKGAKSGYDEELELQDSIKKARRTLAKQLNIDPEKVTELLNSGQLKICSHCNRLEMHDRDGKYFKTPCRKCRKKKREAEK